MAPIEARFVSSPAPEHPGWQWWDISDPTLFTTQAMGRFLVRREGKNRCRLRMFPERRHANITANVVHGGVTLALADTALFATMDILLEGAAEESVTLDLSSQFIGAAHVGQPLDAMTEILRETGRMVFLRGMVLQDDVVISAFSATVRKPSRR
jgi:uncharacterized protein (TIGR00369 family)